MKKTITSFLLGAAVLAPLYLATPAQAQSLRDIQRLEERVQDAKNRGDWSSAQQLERQLNVERLSYQRRNGLGEYHTNSGPMIRFNLGDYRPGYYYRDYDRDNYYNNRGYYDRWGNYHRY